jgi:hypothetical protein
MFLHNATHRWQKRRLEAAAPLRVGWSGGFKPPNAGRSTSIIMQNNSSHPDQHGAAHIDNQIRQTGEQLL